MKRGIGLAVIGTVAGLTLLQAGRRMAARADLRLPADGPRVVILGAGFAGLTAARTLRQRLGRHCQILLIDKHNYHLFTPMLYQAATCGVDPYNVAQPVRDFAAHYGVEFRRATVTGIDFNAQQVQLDNGQVGYDYLIIALGATTNFFGNQAASEHAFPVKWLEDGIAVRNHILDQLEQAAVTTDPDSRRALLTFVVVGGGATGVETAGALANLLNAVVPHDYPQLSRGEARVLVVEAAPQLLGHMGDEMAAIALDALHAKGIEVWLNTEAQDIEPGRVTTKDGRTVEAATVLWATGVQAPDVVAHLDAPHGKGGSLAVDEYLQARGRPDVYAIGDNAHVEDAATHNSVPLLAQSAVDEGATVAENIARAIEGRPQAPFEYHSKGNVVSLGLGQGAAQVDGVVFRGLPAWLFWRLVHLVRITSFRDKAATALDWSMGIVGQEDTTRLGISPS